MTKKSHYISFLWFSIYFLSSASYLFAQEVVKDTTLVIANFGLDADVKSGLLSYSTASGENTDDWFKGDSGNGVIDVSNLDTIALLASGLNIKAQFGMSVTPNSTNGEYLWHDAFFLRDYYCLLYTSPSPRDA